MTTMTWTADDATFVADTDAGAIGADGVLAAAGRCAVTVLSTSIEDRLRRRNRCLGLDWKMNGRCVEEPR